MNSKTAELRVTENHEYSSWGEWKGGGKLRVGISSKFTNLKPGPTSIEKCLELTSLKTSFPIGSMILTLRPTERRRSHFVTMWKLAGGRFSYSFWNLMEWRRFFSTGFEWSEYGCWAFMKFRLLPFASRLFCGNGRCKPRSITLHRDLRRCSIHRPVRFILRIINWWLMMVWWWS